MLQRLGSSLVTFKSKLAGAISRSLAEKLEDTISVKDFGAKGDGVSDDTNAIKLALAVASVNKLKVNLPEGRYRVRETLTIPEGVSLVGAGRECTEVLKYTDNTVSVKVTAPALAGGYTGVLPSNMNAVICLGDAASSRWSGTLKGVSLKGLKDGYEGQVVEFGIVNAGVVSDATIEDVYVYDCQYAAVLPVIFASQVNNIRFTGCLKGFFINNATSTHFSTNYSNSCRDYGYWLRDMKYCNISANACDLLNREDHFPDRTRHCYGYVIESMLGCVVSGNGQEGTLGTNWRLGNFDHSSFTNNTSIRLGSDYTGEDEIAWLDINGVVRNSTIENNFSYAYNAKGLIFGGASGNKHHNIKIDALQYFNANIRNNVVRDSRNGTPDEAGWGNNITKGVANVAAKMRPDRTYLKDDAGAPTLQVQSGGSAVFTYGDNTVHHVHYEGDFVHIFGLFEVTITNVSGTSQFISVRGFPVAKDYAYIGISGVNNGDLGFQDGWIPKSFRMDKGLDGGSMFTSSEKSLRIDKVIAGKKLFISYDGWYRTNP